MRWGYFYEGPNHGKEPEGEKQEELHYYNCPVVIAPETLNGKKLPTSRSPGDFGVGRSVTNRGG